MTLGGSYMPEGTITYPTLGRGKSSSKVPAGRRYVTFSGGYIWCCFSGILEWQSCVSGHHGSQIPPGHPKKTQSPPVFFFVCNLVVACVTHPGNIRHELAVFSTSELMFDWLVLKHNWFKATSSLWSFWKLDSTKTTPCSICINIYIQGYIYIYILCLLSLFDMKPNEIQMNIFWY